MIVGGDFNCMLSDKDRWKPNNDHRNQHMMKYMQNLALKDVWEQEKHGASQYTYINPSNWGYDSRNDYILVSESICRRAVSCKIMSSPAPDHKSVIFNFNLLENKRGPGYWNINTEVHNEEEYNKCVKEVIKTTIGDYNRRL